MKFKRLKEQNLNEVWYETNSVPKYYVYDSSVTGVLQQLSPYSRAAGATITPVPGNVLPNPLPSGAIVVTDQHRAIRKQAHKTLDNTFNGKVLVTKPEDLIEVVPNSTKFLFHHINGKEWDNSPYNVIAVPYNNDNELKLAGFAHWGMHDLYPFPSKVTVPIYEWDGVDWIRKDLIIEVK